MEKARVFKINKNDIFNAWLQVKKNKGGHGSAYKLVRKMKKQNSNMFYHWSFVSY